MEEKRFMIGCAQPLPERQLWFYRAEVPGIHPKAWRPGILCTGNIYSEQCRLHQWHIPYRRSWFLTKSRWNPSSVIHGTLCAYRKDLPEIYNQYEILAKEMNERSEQGKGFTFYHYMLDLSEGPCIQRESRAVIRHRIPRCHAMGRAVPFATSLSGMKRTAWVNIWDGITRPELQCQFTEQLLHEAGVQGLLAKLYCSGGCPANALHCDGLHQRNLRV